VHSPMKNTLVAVLAGDKFYGDKLNAADRALLRQWADDHADDPIWDEILADVRAYDQLPRLLRQRAGREPQHLIRISRQDCRKGRKGCDRSGLL
jgi:hypothetical protein